MSKGLAFQAKLSYPFRDSNLLAQALTHRSHDHGQHNERLEFLGDSILNLVISHQLYLRFPAADEGDLSRLRAHLVKGDRLAEIAQSLGLGHYISMGPGELKSGGFRRASILEDAIEALVGAIYLDGGFDAAEQFIFSLYESRFQALPELDTIKDPKTRLQELLQAKKLPLPQYRVEETTGADHERHFKVSCTVSGLEAPTFGVAESRRKAEQICAQLALDALRL